MSKTPKRSEPLLFAMLAVEKKLATPAEIADALRADPDCSAATLATRLVQRSVLSPEASRLLQGELDRMACGDCATLAEPGGPAPSRGVLGVPPPELDRGHATLVGDAARAADRQAPVPDHPTLAAGRADLPGFGQDEAESLPVEGEGRYELRGVQGRGGQARVMLAYDELLEREVAFKVLRDPGESSPPGSTPSFPSQRSTPGTMRFLREARLTGLLEHPNIVPVYELGRTRDGSLYYTMRMVRGSTLSASLKQCKGLQERLKRLGPFWDICNAVAFAHSRGVVHRDLKPDNVMVGEFGETVLLDWGVAKVKGQRDIRARELRKEYEALQKLGSSNETQAGAAVGTPSYMSPEQAEGLVDEIDDRSDVWGLGAVLYEILTGVPPFKAPIPAVTLRQVACEPLIPVRERCAEAPPELAAIAEKALQKRKEDRYQSAKDLAAEVEAFMTGGRVRAYHYSAWELVRRFAVHHKAAFGAAAAALLVIVGALISVSVSLRGEQLARAQEHRERLAANFHLAQAFTEKAQRLAAEQRFMSAAVFASAALAHNPAHPKSPYFDALFAREHPGSATARVVAASQVYLSRFGELAQLARVLPGEDAFEQVAFSPDGKLLAAAEGRRIRLWDAATGAPRARLDGHADRVHALAFSPDGKRLVSGARDRAVVIWDLASGRELSRMLGHSDAVWRVAYSPDGTLVASGGWDGVVRIWDAARGATLATLQGHSARINGLAFAPDGARLATASADRTVLFWNARSGDQLPLALEHESEVFALAFSPDGHKLATAASDFELRLFDAGSGKELESFKGHQEGALALGFTPDGSQLVSAGYDKTVRFWDLRSGRALLSLEAHQDFVFGLAISPDGARLATASYDRTVKLWDLRAASGVPTLSGHTDLVYALGVSRDGTRLASGGWDRTIRLWDLGQKKLLRELVHGDVVDGGLVFTPDGSRLVSGARDKLIKVWDVRTGEQRLTLAGARLAVRGLSISPDGKRLASAGLDRVVRFWDLASGRSTLALPEAAETIDRTAFSPDGRQLAIACYDKTVRLLDADSGRQVRQFAGHGDWVSSVVFSPDGKRLASSGKDGSAILWDAQSGALSRRLEGHKQWVNEVRFSPDGALVATGSDDQTVRVWSAEGGETRLIIPASREVVALDFSPDGRTLIVGDGFDVRLYPLDFSALEADPRQLLADAERRAGAGLDGFELKALSPTE